MVGYPKEAWLGVVRTYQATPTPFRVMQREMGFPRIPRGSGTGVKFPFMDMVDSTISSLTWSNDHISQANLLSSSSNPIPIYCLAKKSPSPGGTQSPHLFVGDEAGFLHVFLYWFIQNHPHKTLLEKRQQIHVASNTAVTCVKPMGEKILVGTGSGHIGILNEHGDDIFASIEAHTKAVKNIDSLDGQVIISCGKDNRICVFDLRVQSCCLKGKPVNVISDAHCSEGHGHMPSSNSNTPGRKKKNASASVSHCVTDFVFLDELNIISSGSSDGRLKQWDLRTSYKHMKKSNPLVVTEYPSNSNLRGYSCLRLKDRKLYASSVHSEIFEFDVGNMQHVATYQSPSRISNYTKFDLSHDGAYLASGCDDAYAYIFSTNPRRPRKGPGEPSRPSLLSSVPVITPFKRLDHTQIDSQAAICCTLFSPFDDLVLTTGGDASFVSKFLPSSILFSSKELEKEARKNELENPPLDPPLTTEFLVTKSYQNSQFHQQLSPLNTKENSTATSTGPPLTPRKREKVCFAKLDSFPNYVIDGMCLPHVQEKTRKIEIKAKEPVTPFTWALSDEAKKAVMNLNTMKLEVTPKRSNPRKKRKFTEDVKSPKILEYFSPTNSKSKSKMTSNAVVGESKTDI